MKIIKPTEDCDTCNQDSVDENGDFRCNWRYPKPVKVVKSGRCFHVVEINKVYEDAVKEGDRLRNEDNI
jgi:hypothetical protein